ncbi:hypothetical protein G7Z17_g5926 [Cylindrodendrum hubeiense]|uniref:NADAR domain-containing protein n=1 Tax=Cylindrodendrum hubeiense TaxID=595255 RepID=A0A9P5LHB8_9HYPO|nr:hypothetical protein G7Z17_g5926 [Cylindrodendrum hubeiense]
MPRRKNCQVHQQEQLPKGSKAKPGPLFFYMPNATHGEFCQWYPCTFTVSRDEIFRLVGHTTRTTSDDPDLDIKFNCSEQFMMYCKAAHFEDTDRQTRVLASDNPKEQKRLGKLTVGFTEQNWRPIKSLVVEAGNMAKFGQNIHLRRKLLATGDRLLCEAASRDRVWGIGYSEKHAMNHQIHWGENRLGKALMAVRERLRHAEEAEMQDHWHHWR